MAQTLTNASFQVGLTATGTPTRSAVSGSYTVGKSLARTLFPTADIAYSFTLAATTASDVAEVNLSSGNVTATAGSPTIGDDQVDPEGKAPATAARIYAVVVECITSQTCAIAGSSGLMATTAGTMDLAGSVTAFMTPLGDTGLGTINFTFTGTGGLHRATIIGKSS